MPDDPHGTVLHGKSQVPPEQDPYQTIVRPQVKDPLIGSVVGNCRIESVLGEGGMSVVYLGRHQSLDLPRVIKVLRHGLLDYENLKSRFLKEARLVARLDHPGIVRVFNTGEDGGVAYIEMEYIEGRSLRQHLGESGKMPESQAIGVALEVASALNYAHNSSLSDTPDGPRGIVHRDIKPENILLGKDGKAKLADFGVAKQLDATSETMPGTVVGTYAYMAPEQIDGKQVGPQSDLFSLGVVLCEMLLGEIPFSGKTAAKLAMEITSGSYPKVKEIKGISSLLKSTIEKSMALDPVNRFASAEDMLHSLSACTNAASGSTGKSRNRPAVKTLTGALLLIIIIAVAINIYRVGSSGGKAKSSEGKSMPEPTARKKTSAKMDPQPVAEKRGKARDKKRLKKLPKNRIQMASPKAPRVRVARSAAASAPVTSQKINQFQKGMAFESEKNWKRAIEAYELVRAPSGGGKESVFIDARLRMATIYSNALRKNDLSIGILEGITGHFAYLELSNRLAAAYLKERQYVKACGLSRKSINDRYGCYKPGCKSKLVETWRILALASEARFLIHGEKDQGNISVQAWKKVLRFGCGAESGSKTCLEAERHLNSMTKRLQ